jgi:hypothetical protein
MGDVHLLKLDCEGGEYAILVSLAESGRLSDVGWIRGGHGRRHRRQVIDALTATLLRASGIPARIVASYPSWWGPLQTHYIVEAYMPEYGWYSIESTMCQSPWPNTHQVNFAIIPPQHEDRLMPGHAWALALGSLISPSRRCL